MCVCFFKFHSLNFFYLFGFIFINSLYWKHLVEHRTNCWMHKKRFARISRKKPLVVVLSSRFFHCFLQVSFFSTSPELSNKQRFEYFSRTIPSDHYQVKAMVDIVRRMGWSYVSIIYEESNYGIKVSLLT